MPKSIDDETIVIAATFREGGRFPVLSYRHETGVSFLLSRFRLKPVITFLLEFRKKKYLKKYVELYK